MRLSLSGERHQTTASAEHIVELGKMLGFTAARTVTEFDELTLLDVWDQIQHAVRDVILRMLRGLATTGTGSSHRLSEDRGYRSGKAARWVGSHPANPPGGFLRSEIARAHYGGRSRKGALLSVGG
jgi:hypothetical protein